MTAPSPAATPGPAPGPVPSAVAPRAGARAGRTAEQTQFAGLLNRTLAGPGAANAPPAGTDAAPGPGQATAAPASPPGAAPPGAADAGTSPDPAIISTTDLVEGTAGAAKAGVGTPTVGDGIGSRDAGTEPDKPAAADAGTDTGTEQVQATPAIPILPSPELTAAILAPPAQTAPASSAPVQTAAAQTVTVQTATVQTATVQTATVQTAAAQTAVGQDRPGQASGNADTAKAARGGRAGLLADDAHPVAADPADGTDQRPDAAASGAAASKARPGPANATLRQATSASQTPPTEPSVALAGGVAGPSTPGQGQEQAGLAHAAAPTIQPSRATLATVETQAAAPASAADPAASAVPAWMLPGTLPTAALPAASAPSPAPSSATAAASAPAAQVAPALFQLATTPNGGQSMVLRLDPLELGRVEIRVDRGSDGPAAVQLTVERPDTLMLLLRDQTALHKALDQAGLPADRTVQFHLGSPASASGSSDLSQSGAGQSGTGQSGMGQSGTGQPNAGRSDSGWTADPGSDGRGAWGGQGGGQGTGQNQGDWNRRSQPDRGRIETATNDWLRAGINITA